MRLRAIIPLLALATGLSGALGAQAAPLGVGVCPARKLHAVSLAPGTRFQSLVVPNLAVANGGPDAAEIVGIDIELADHGVVMDTRRLTGDALHAALKSGAAVQNGPLQAFPFQFCDGRLLGADPHLSPTSALPPGAGGLVTNQAFAWKGSRDELRVSVSATRGGTPEQASLSVPIDSGVVRAPLRFPLQGRWFVPVAGTPHGGHRWALPEAFALDIAAIGADDRSFRNSGERFEDYYAYGAPVLAAADGTVVEVVDDQPEDPGVLRRPGESVEAYGERAGAIQDRLLARGERGIAGDSVLVDLGGGEFALYAHLKPGSILVKRGQRVASGAPIARLGASGNATEPHLHFQVCDAPSALHCAGVPLAFGNVELPYADGPRAIQAGDIVVTR